MRPYFVLPHLSHFLGISFTPREIGEHLVNVYRNGQHIPNSPFKIYVGESEIGNARKVKVSGTGLLTGMANELNEFTVNTKEAGMDARWSDTIVCMKRCSDTIVCLKHVIMLNK